MDKVSAKKENDKMMTFREAVKALDAEGVYAAKRPSMVGYAFKSVQNADGTDAGGVRVVVMAKDGTTAEIALSASGLAEGVKGIDADVEKFNAFVFAEDWELSLRAELEKARAGEGTM